MAACKSWLVAAITRTSARIRRLPPMRSNSCSCKTRRSAIWCSDNLFKHRGFVDFFTHSHVLALKPIFSLLAILDVGTGNIPSRDLPFVVAHRIVPNEKPTITYVSFAQSHLQLESRANRTSTVKKGAHPIPVIEVNEPTHIAYLPPLFQAEAQIIKPRAVGINTFVVGSE